MSPLDKALENERRKRQQESSNILPDNAGKTTHHAQIRRSLFEAGKGIPLWRRVLREIGLRIMNPPL
jgi:hypothetical protein